MHTLKNKFFKTLVYRKVGYCFIHNQLQAAVEKRCVNGCKSVPVGEHLSTGQSLYSASLLQSSGVLIEKPTWYLVRHFGLPFTMIP